MEGQKEQKFQELLTEIGHKLQPNDVEILKNQLKFKKRFPPSVLDDIDSRGRNSGLYFLHKLQEEGHLAEDNLKLLKELFQAIGRRDLLEKLFEFDKKKKKYEKTSSEVKGAIAGETGGRPSSFRRAASWLWRSITRRPSTPPNPRPPLYCPSLSSNRKDIFDEEFEQLSYGTILHTEHVKIDVEGGFHDLSSFGVLLQIPPNAVTGPTDITCVKFSPFFRSPTEENDTLVSCGVAFSSTSVLRLKKPMIVTLKHSGPSKKEGYETIVKAWKEPVRENYWNQIKEMREDSPLAREHFGSGYIQVEIKMQEDRPLAREFFESGFIEVEISEWTALAVFTRLITDTFEVTDKGCVVRSSVCDDVTVEFPVGAVEKTHTGSMKLFLMPDQIDILGGIAAYPCPMLLIDGFKRVSFNIPVKIRLPHPCPAGYPSENVRLLTMNDKYLSTMYHPHEWKDITDEVDHIDEDEPFIEVQVSHFSWLWVWIYDVPLTVVSSLSRYLFKAPQDVFFAIFKETEVCSDISLTMTLVCVPNHEQLKITAAMKEEGYTKLASSTANKKMRPDDKAYTKVEGCYKKKLEEEEDIFLQFIENDICRKELPLLRKNNKGETSAESDTSKELVISFLENKDGDVKDNLCKLCIDETKIVPKRMEKELSPMPVVRKVETDGLESAPSELSAASGKELEICFGDKSIATIDSKEAASKVADFLKLDKLSLDDPPDDIVVKCRGLCSYLKSNRRGDIVKQIRDKLPSGMTGPLGNGNLLVKDMDYRTKEQISWSLMAAEDQWKLFAENVGVSKDKTRFYDKREKNPVLVILDEHCGNMTVEELYVHIVESGANAIADNHL